MAALEWSKDVSKIETNWHCVMDYHLHFEPYQVILFPFEEHFCHNPYSRRVACDGESVCVSRDCLCKLCGIVPSALHKILQRPC